MVKYWVRLFKLINKLKILKSAATNISANPVEIALPPGNNFLIIAPHPDDEIIGCGGLILKLLTSKKNIRLFYNKTNDEIRKCEALEVCAKLNITPQFANNYFRNELKDFLKNNIIDTIVIPNIIDNHSDHQEIVNDLYFILKNYIANNYKILMYEIWTAHQPNVIIDISDVMQEKIKLLKIYKSQLINKDYEYIIRGLNSYRTAYLKNQNGFAESFVLLHNVSEFLYLFETLTKK